MIITGEIVLLTRIMFILGLLIGIVITFIAQILRRKMNEYLEKQAKSKRDFFKSYGKQALKAHDEWEKDD